MNPEVRSTIVRDFVTGMCAVGTSRVTEKSCSLCLNRWRRADGDAGSAIHLVVTASKHCNGVGEALSGGHSLLDHENQSCPLLCR